MRPQPQAREIFASFPSPSLCYRATARSFLVGILTTPAAEPCYPRLIAELSFKMPTLCSLPQIERNVQDGGPCLPEDYIRPLEIVGHARSLKLWRFKRSCPSMTA